MSLTTASTSSGSNELDERVLAKASLEAAEELLQSLCASHAGTFVSVERRARTMQQGLEDLLAATKAVQLKLQKAQEALEHEEQGGGGSVTGGDEGGGGERVENSSNHDKGHSTIAILSEKHRVRRRTLLQHSSLLELLELPSLMDACVRSNLYEEALSIAAFANTLERRHCNNNTNATAGQQNQNQQSQQVIVVARVIEQIRSRQIDLRRHLLHRLKTTVTMPECLEVVTALRRLNSIALERRQQLQMSSSSSSSSSNSNSSSADLERVHAAMELRLQVDFLEARDFWLETSSSATTTTAMNQASSSTMTKGTATSAVTATSSEEDLLDTIERYRTRVFEVATRE
jgi:conserved oligomeric Golgi complex subunit 8